MASFALGAGSGLKPKAAPVEIKPAKPYEERIKYPVAFLKKFQEVRTVPAAGRRTYARTRTSHTPARCCRLCRVARPEPPVVLSSPSPAVLARVRRVCVSAFRPQGRLGGASVSRGGCFGRQSCGGT